VNIIRKKTKRSQKITIIATVILLTSIIAIESIQSEENGTLVKIENISLKPNEIKSSKILIQNIENLGSFKISLSYNPAILELRDVNDCGIEEIYSYHNSPAGILNVTGYNISAITTDEICIAEMDFKAIGADESSCDISLETTELLTADSTPAHIPHETSDGKATIKTENNPPGGNGGGEFIKKAPVADASLSEKYGTINTLIIFDGSNSYDPDGDIVGYRWDFDGDESFDTDWLSEPTTSNLYTKVGQYSVKLQVKDNDEQTDSDTLTVIISQPNKNPSAPTIVKAVNNGTINKKYNFTVVAQDPDGDDIKYIFDWDDSTNKTETNYTLNNTDADAIHNWTTSGIYIVKIQAEDINNAKSPNTQHILFIDIDYIKIDELDGYLIDTDQDGEYDKFYKPDSDERIDLEKEDGVYLLDYDNDGKYDYKYSNTDGLTDYEETQQPDEPEDEKNEKSNLEIYYFLAVIVIAVIGLVVLYKRKMKKNK